MISVSHKLIEANENLVGGICCQDIVVNEHTCHRDQKPEEQETSNGSHFFTRFRVEASFGCRTAQNVSHSETYSRMDRCAYFCIESRNGSNE